MSDPKLYRVQIPQELLDAGFPVEWIVVSDQGSVMVHYGTPVLLEDLTLDDRKVINNHITTGLKLLIGTGQTVELKMELAQPYLDERETDKCQCGKPARCNRRVMERAYGTMQACDRLRDHPNDCDLTCIRSVPMYYFDIEAMTRRLWSGGIFDSDRFCVICGQRSAVLDLLEEATTMVNSLKRASPNTNPTKAERMLERMKKKLDK